MHLLTVHARELPVPAADAGALLDSLGGPGDRLWPNDTWPASALRLEQPLRVGSRGGHGEIRYHVGAYEPGRRVVFVFEPQSGRADQANGLFGKLYFAAIAPFRYLIVYPPLIRGIGQEWQAGMSMAQGVAQQQQASGPSPTSPIVAGHA